MNVLSLCSGIGGLELAIRAAIPGTRVVGYVERDAYAEAVLVARMADSSLDQAPIWRDLESVPCASLRGRVDLISSGFPCQPVSLAGKGLAQSDERWIWPDIARIIRDVGPGLVFLENVSGLRRRGLGHVLGDLAALGLDAEWTCLRAADIGAPHLRERVFVLAYSGSSKLWIESRRSGGPRWTFPAEPTASGANAGRLPAPALGRGPDGLPGWVDRLRCLGNAVVPQQAEAALRELLGRLTTGPATR